MQSDLVPSAEDPVTPPTAVSVVTVTDLVKKEPVVAGYLAVWILANLGAFLIGHTHLVDAATWSTFSTTITPVLSGLILGGLAWLTRRVVEPVFKKL